MTFAIVFAPEAEEQLAEIYAYVAARASPDSASNYTAAIVASYIHESASRAEEEH